jgi:hypothetical protein
MPVSAAIGRFQIVAEISASAASIVAPCPIGMRNAEATLPSVIRGAELLPIAALQIRRDASTGRPPSTAAEYFLGLDAR